MNPGSIDAACEAACRTIAPVWPLDQAIAVNPHWGRIDRPVREVAARMAVLAGIQVFPPRALVREAWSTGRITAADLAEALVTVRGVPERGLTAADCIEALGREPGISQLPLLIDRLDDDPEGRTRLSWRQAITHQISQTCAAYFDEIQADWKREASGDLYAFWRDTLAHDHGIGVLMGVPGLGRHLLTLPPTRAEAETWALERLGLPASAWTAYLEAVLLTVNGWASWCAYLGWQARLRGETDSHLRALLAVRLAWGAMLLECRDERSSREAFRAIEAEWRELPARLREAEERLILDEVWQRALENGYQRELGRALVRPAVGVGEGARPVEVQAAFCIDVRSERFRRALETAAPRVRTLGFAGFFGIPAAYTPLGTTARRPQLPGLLEPTLEVTDRVVTTDPGADRSAVATAARNARARRFTIADRLQTATQWPATAFSFVEAAGPGFLGALAGWLLPSSKPRERLDLEGLPARHRDLVRPALPDANPETQAAICVRILRAMGLERPLAPLVLLVGHGSQTANNAQAAALDCGACGGQTGEMNARLLAQWLNDPAVREALRGDGIEIPQDTFFLACLHNTTTDEIESFDLDLLPDGARKAWAELQPSLAAAGDAVRRERAASLGERTDTDPDTLLKQFRRRANDGARTRPEWGLAGNAAFIIAPRHRTRGLDLRGRSFLHDYDARRDEDGSILEMLMTAPMVVTNWINWQYHASTCDPGRLGSGNKVLHNVVGGRIGVFEGNGGDLRIGLSKQSLHDGKRDVHEPLRLTVVIEAGRDAIESVVRRHEAVRQLVEHGWLHLWQIGDEGLSGYEGGAWRRLDPRGTVSRPRPRKEERASL